MFSFDFISSSSEERSSAGGSSDDENCTSGELDDSSKTTIGNAETRATRVTERAISEREFLSKSKKLMNRLEKPGQGPNYGVLPALGGCGLLSADCHCVKKM